MRVEIDLNINRIDQDNIKVGMTVIDGENKVSCKIKPTDSFYLLVGDELHINLPFDFTLTAD